MCPFILGFHVVNLQEKKTMKKNHFPAVISFRVSPEEKTQFEKLIPEVSKSEFFRTQLKRVLTSKKVKQ
jgi:hypothetical protein